MQNDRVRPYKKFKNWKTGEYKRFQIIKDIKKMKTYGNKRHYEKKMEQTDLKNSKRF